jgi:hypothetical protein
MTKTHDTLAPSDDIPPNFQQADNDAAKRPARIGRRIGIRSRITIAKLVEKLADRIAIDRELGAPILVARHGFVFEQPAHTLNCERWLLSRCLIVNPHKGQSQ